MDTVNPAFSSLFSQLGLDNDEEAIQQFIASHQLPPHVRIADAPYWNAAQRAFIEEAILEDAQWAEVIGHLDSSLHQ